MTKITPYTMLDLASVASVEEVENAFQKIKKECGPGTVYYRKIPSKYVAAEMAYNMIKDSNAATQRSVPELAVVSPRQIVGELRKNTPLETMVRSPPLPVEYIRKMSYHAIEHKNALELTDRWAVAGAITGLIGGTAGYFGIDESYMGVAIGAFVGAAIPAVGMVMHIYGKSLYQKYLQ